MVVVVRFDSDGKDERVVRLRSKEISVLDEHLRHSTSTFRRSTTTKTSIDIPSLSLSASLGMDDDETS